VIAVDPQDQWLLDTYSWSITSKGYVKTNVRVSPTKRVTTFLHHCIVGQPIWENEEIDHENRNKLDCRRENLRYISTSGNQVNTDREPGSSGERNIWKRGSKYQVNVTRECARYTLGTFDTLDEARVARDAYICR
jgi:hypothetical protein